MAARKLDFAVQLPAEFSDAPGSLKAGSVVSLNSPDSDEILQVQYKGSVIGQVPTDQQQQLASSSCACTVRSIRKVDGNVSQILVRAVMAESVPSHLPDIPVIDSTKPEELEGTTQLPQNQLELLVSDESLRGMLKDERLQKEIIAIDTADDREEALQQHFQNPEFKAFADQVLASVAAS